MKEGKIETIEKEDKFSPEIEIGDFKSVEGLILYSILQKSCDESGDEGENKESEEVIQYFKDKDVNEFKKEIDKLTEQADEETLNWLAFGFGKDVKKEITEQMIQYKEFDNEKAEKLIEDFNELLNDFNNKHGESKQILKDFTEKDIEAREGDKEDLEEELNKAVDFFNPQKQTTETEKVVYLPSNPLIRKETGFAINLGENVFIVGDKDNRINQVHEFLHPIINPITEKITFTEKEQDKIIETSSDKLKKDQGYGGDYSSLLNETLIRTYVYAFSKDREIDFGPLGDKTYKSYENYSEARRENSNLTFEDYFRENYQEILT